MIPFWNKHLAPGRIWLRVASAAHRRAVPDTTKLGARVVVKNYYEPAIYDVFDPTGEDVGRVDAPADATFLVRRGDQVWGAARDADDTPQIKRWRIKWR